MQDRKLFQHDYRGSSHLIIRQIDTIPLLRFSMLKIYYSQLLPSYMQDRKLSQHDYRQSFHLIAYHIDSTLPLLRFSVLKVYEILTAISYILPEDGSL